MPSPASQNIVLIKEIRDGIVILKDNSYRAVLMVSSLNFELLSEEERDAITLNYQNFLNSLDFPLQILIQSRKINIGQYIDSLNKIEKTQKSELLRIQTAEYRDFVQGLVELENIMNKTFYIIVPFVSFVAQTKTFASAITGLLHPSKITSERAESFKQAKDQLMQRVNHIQLGLQNLDIRSIPLNTEELVELYYQVYNPEATTIGNIAEAIKE